MAQRILTCYAIIQYKTSSCVYASPFQSDDIDIIYYVNITVYIIMNAIFID